MALTDELRQTYFKKVKKRLSSELIEGTKKLIFGHSPYQQEKNREIFQHTNKILDGDMHFIQEQFYAFLNFLEKTGARISEAPTHFFEAPIIQTLLALLCEKIHQSYLSVENRDDVPDDSMSGITALFIQENLNTWVAEQYAPLDQREHITDDLKPKRMDSLARLLAIDTDLSACSAVTIDASTNDPRLIIALNVTTDGTQEKIFRQVDIRLTIIKNHLEETSRYIPEAEEHHQAIDELTWEIERRSQDLVDRLSAVTQSKIPSDILLSAAKKIMFSYYLDNEPFTPKEKSAFLINAPAIFLLPQSGSYGLQMQVIEVIPSGTTSRDIELTGLSDKATVRGIHAEQMINQFLFNSIKSPPRSPRVIGTSKLCCETCYDNIKTNPNAIVRGRSGKLFPGSVNLSTGEVATSSSEIRHAPTDAKPSPKDTPEQRLRNKNPGVLRSQMERKRRRLREILEEAYLQDHPHEMQSEIFISPNAVESDKKRRKIQPTLPSSGYSTLSTSSSCSSLENHVVLIEEIECASNQSYANQSNVSDGLHERCSNSTTTFTSPNAVESRNPALSPKSPNSRMNDGPAQTGLFSFFGSHTSSTTTTSVNYPMSETGKPG